MSKYVVITFPTEEKAYEGTRALQDLHEEGSLTLYAAAVLAKDAEGRLTMREEQDQGPVGTAVGSMVGALIGAFGGPAGFAAGMAGGALIGSLADLSDAGVGSEFLSDVAAQMEEAPAAVVAEIEEGWVLPLDTRMETLGGVVLRHYRIDVEDAQLDREIDAMNQEMDELDAEMAQASDEAKAKLKVKRDHVQAKLQKARERAKARTEAVKNEANAKSSALKAQIDKASGETKAWFEERHKKLQADRAAFSDRLKQAWERTKEKLG